MHLFNYGSGYLEGRSCLITRTLAGPFKEPCSHYEKLGFRGKVSKAKQAESVRCDRISLVTHNPHNPTDFVSNSMHAYVD